MPLLPPEAAQAVARTYRDYLALGHDVEAGPGCRSVRCDAAPVIYDANHLQAVTAESPEGVAAALAHLEEALGDRAHRHVLTDPAAPPAVTAGLALAGFEGTPTLQLLLAGELQGPPPVPAELEPVASEADWSALHRLVRADHVESNQKKGTEIYSERTTEQMMVTKRLKAPSVQFFLARVAGEPVAFFSSWPGKGGVGMVEDLFTLPSHRRRGAGACPDPSLCHRCANARRRPGADRRRPGRHAHARLRGHGLPADLPDVELDP